MRPVVPTAEDPLEEGTTKLLPVLVITAAHSRFIVARMIPTRTTEDLLLGSWELIGQLGRVPRRLFWDNEPGIGRGTRLAEGVAAFMGTLATRLVLPPPRDPGSKSLVECRNGWFETSFMPDRTFTSPADFNLQFTEWFSRANTRVVRTIGASPMERFDADREAMLPLPSVPFHLGWRTHVRLGRDYYVRLDNNDYAVDPSAIGWMVDVSADFDRVKVRADGRIVADHARRWARRGTVTDPAHVEVAARLRRQFRQPRLAASGDDLGRDLADYDRTLGLIDGREADERAAGDRGGQADPLSDRHVEGPTDLRCLLGPPGTGKTHLAIGLGIVAARHGVRVLFATATDWVTRLTEAHRQGGFRRSCPGCAATG